MIYGTIDTEAHTDTQRNCHIPQACVSRVNNSGVGMEFPCSVSNSDGIDKNST